MKNLMNLCLLMMLSVGAFAQEGVKVGLSFGPAFNSYKTTVDGTSSDEMKGSGTGYRLAINGTYGFTENVSLYTGVGLVGKNFKNKDADTKSTNTYLEIPLGIRMRTSELSSGIYAGALVAPTIDINLGSKLKSDDGDVDTKEFTKTFGTSIKMGLFVEKELDFGRVFFMPAYNLGLSKTNSITEVAGSDIVTKFNYFELSLGFFF